MQVKFNGGKIVVDTDALNVSMGHGLHGAYDATGRYALIVLDQEECVPWLSASAVKSGKDSKLVASTAGSIALPTGNKLQVNVMQGKAKTGGPTINKAFGS